MDTSDPLYSEILASRPSPETLLLILSRMKEKGQTKEVIQECLKALSIYPDDTRIRTLLAESYLEEGQLSDAESELGKVVTRIDDLVSAYILQAEIFIRQKRTQEALQALKLYLAHHPNDDGALYLLKELQTTEGVSTAELTQSRRGISMERPDKDNEMPVQPHTRIREDKAMERKRKMISVLESWLAAVQEQSKAGHNNSGGFGPWPVDH